MRRDGGSVFPARANTGDPNGPVGGLSANEIARALISMMARSTTCSNQRPDTLMRDRICRIEENLLQRTAGPYIRVIRVVSAVSAACPLCPRSPTLEQTSICDALGHL